MDESRANKLRDIDILSGGSITGSDAASVMDITGEPLFVINLCAGMTPIDLNSLGLIGLDHYKLYQVSRMEDGRRRYRLRLGFFTTEALAEDVLSSVRSRYATAFTSCLCEEDLKHATGYLKCSVQDLQRTGRYAVQKLRGDGNGTTSIRALDATTLQTLRAAEARSSDTSTTIVQQTLAAKPPVTKSPLQNDVTPKATVAALKTATNTAKPRAVDEVVVEANWQADSRSLKAPPPKQPPAAQRLAAKIVQSQSVPLVETVKSDAAILLGASDAPKRESLMRRAHAMAPVDAVERRKAVPDQSAHDSDNISSGRFVAPSIPTASKIKAPPAPPASLVRPAPSQLAPSVQPVALQASTPPRHTPAATPHRNNQPFHVGAGVQIPETSLSLETSEPEIALQSAAKVTQVSPVFAPAAQVTTTNDLLRARELAKQSAQWESSQWRNGQVEVPTLDTTQTIRTLTKNELEDANRAKWFTVQLAISDHPANLDTMPKLDIFQAYSLYSVATLEGSGIRHALRLGFFREEVSAEAVRGYLKTFFNEPVIVRIPDAEHERFADVPKLKSDMDHSQVVTLEQKRSAPPTTLAALKNVPTINTTVERRAAPRATPTAQKPMPRAAAPATKSAAQSNYSAAPRKQSANTNKPAARTSQRDMLEDARMLGLSDTQMIRVQKNPSLLARLVGKLGK